MTKEKILGVADSLSGPTGFANSALGVIWSLAEKYDVHYLGLQSVHDEKVKINIEGIQREVIQHANLPRGKDRWDFGRRSLPRLLDQLEPEILLTFNDIQMVQHVPEVMCPNQINLQVMDLPSKKFISDEAMRIQMEGQLQRFKERFPRTTHWVAYCFTPDTEVITPDGIRNITELNVGDEVYSLNKKTNNIEIKPITHTTRMYFEGNLISIEGHKFDFQVTPEHRFWLDNKEVRAEKLLNLSSGATRKFPRYNKFKGKIKELFNFYEHFDDSYIIRCRTELTATDFQKIPRSDYEYWYQNHSDDIYFHEIKYGDISDITNYNPESFYAKSVSRNQEVIPLRVKWKDFLTLAGWYVSEGYLNKESHPIKDSEEDYTVFSINISQEIPENRKKICELLDRMKIKYNKKTSSIKISGRFYYHLFNKLFHNGTGINEAKNKYIPKWFFKYEGMEYLFQSLMDGDGTWDNRENCVGRYVTSSEELSNDIIQLSLLLGYKARRYNMNESGCYTIGISKSEIAPIITKSHMDTIKYNGNVYCITVKDNETLFAGRNKKFNASMNCPQDGDPPMPQWEQIYKMADQVIAMSDYGKWVFKRWFDMDVPRIWHGVDTNIFTNQKKPKQFEDKFVIGNLNRNQPRKQPVRTMIAFARFAHDKPDVLLHMQMDWNDEFGWPLGYFAQQYGIQNKMIQPAPVGIPREKVAEIYNMWDLNTMLCFHPDTPVITNPGVKNIKDINEGDKVIGNDGKFYKVNNKFKYKWNGELLKIKSTYLDEFKVTPNHKIFRLNKNVFKNQHEKRKAKNNPELEEIEANKLHVGDVLVFPRFKETIKSDESNDLMRLYGLYLSEGCIIQHKKRNKIEGIVFSINTKETELTDFIINIMKNEFNLNAIIKDNTRHRRTIWFYSAKLGRQFKQMFSDNSHTKTIPSKFIYYQKDKLISLIKGLWDGDGYIGEKRKDRSTSYEYTTVSKQLGYQIWMILQKIGYISSLHMTKRISDVYRIRISGHQRFGDILRYDERNVGRKLSIGWLDDDYVYYPIRKIEKEKYEGYVYDLSVNNIHSYCSPLLGHNSGGEGFGLNFIEGFACGLPCIASDYTTSKELLIDGEPTPRGDLVKVLDLHWQKMDVAAVRRALIDCDDATKLMNKYYYNRDLVIQNGKNAEEWAKKNVSWGVIAPQWLKIIGDVLSGEAINS